MLGQEELEKYFPDQKLRVFVGSWNMNGQTPPGKIFPFSLYSNNLITIILAAAFLADFLLPHDIEYVPDLLVVGTQVEHFRLK